MPFLEEDPQRVNVPPGQTVYFRYLISWGLIFEEADNQERADRHGEHTHPIELKANPFDALSLAQGKPSDAMQRKATAVHLSKRVECPEQATARRMG
jgi:hypothetical protein